MAAQSICSDISAARSIRQGERSEFSGMVGMLPRIFAILPHQNRLGSYFRTSRVYAVNRAQNADV
jgi:hypothetical protein